MRGNPLPPIAAVALLVLASCRGGDAPPALAPPARPVALIGWDGADWEVAEPLLARGELPNLEALRRRGASGDLRSPAPRLSPLLWTTIATGRPPEIHGVLDFLEPDPGGGALRPISRASRRSAALWEIASASRRSCGVVGWWATHPAQALEGGFMVSDALAASSLAGRTHASQDVDLSASVLPAALREAAGRARVAPAEVPDAEMARLLAPGPPDVVLEQQLRSIVAATLSYQRVTLAALRSGQPELLLVYFQGIDEVSHLLAHCASPSLPACPAARAERGRATIAAFYAFQDRLLGELLAALSPQTTVMLVSDHGFLSGSRRPLGRTPDVADEPGRWHRDTGIVVVSGPDVAAGKLEAVELGEIAPTVLWLLGLPVAENFEGRPRRDLLQAEGASRPVDTIPDWDAVVAVPAVAAQPAAGEAERSRIESLRTLGYVSSASVAAGAAGGRTVAADVNLAWRRIQTRRLEEAKETAASAARRAPGYAPAWIALGEARAAARERGEAAAAFGRALHILGRRADPDLWVRWAAVAGPDPDPELVAMLGIADRDGSAETSTARGLLLLAAGATGRSEAALREALRRDPAQIEALAALFESARRRGAERSLEPDLRRALQADPGAILPRNWLALVRETQGDAQEAERLLREAVALAPRHAGSRINLGALLGRAGRSAEAERTLEEALLLAPDAVEARVGLAVLLSRDSRLGEARDLLEAAAPAARTDPRLLNTLALVYRDLGLREEATAALRASLAAERDQPEAAALLRSLEGGT